MNIIHDWPPNIDAIRKVFPDLPKGVIFCYAPDIYVPGGADVPPHIIDHEAIHIDQQGEFPELWWRKYLADPKFRLREEVPAHIAEYASIVKSGKSRPIRRRALKAIAARLSGKLYGHLLKKKDAERIIKGAVG